MRARFPAVAAAFLLACSVSAVLAQDTDPVEVVVLDVRDDGIVVLDVDGRRMFAVSDTMMRNALRANAELEAAERELAGKDSLLASYETAIGRYEDARSRQGDYLAELEEVAEGYRDLVADYRELREESWLSFEGGLGASGDAEPAILMGVAVRRLRVWGFLQESNAGGLIGVSLPVF